MVWSENEIEEWMPNTHTQTNMQFTGLDKTYAQLN